MTGFVKYWPDLLHGLGAILEATGALLTLAAQSKDPVRRGDG
jgi:hypothetical protein